VVEQVAAADYCNVFGDAETRFEQSGDGAVCGSVVVAENSIGARMGLQKFFRGVVAGLVAQFLNAIDVIDELRISDQAELSESALVAFLAADKRTDFSASDVSEALAADFGQVARGKGAHFFVVDTDEVRGEASEAAVDQNVGDAGFFYTAEHLDGPLRGSDEEGVHATSDELLDGLPFHFRILFGRRGDERVTGVVQRG